MKNKIFGRNGGATIFLCIILSAVILTEGVLYYAARLRGSEADLARCMRIQISQILCNYNRPLLENYGLYGLDEASVNTQVFDACFSGKEDFALTANPYALITTEDLRMGITDYMQIRMPAIASNEILSRFKGVFREIRESSVFKKAKTLESSPWLGYVKNFLGQKEKWSNVISSVLSAAEVIDISGKLSELEEFSSSIQQEMARNTTLYLQGESATDISEGILNPDNLSKIMSYADSYMNFELPDIADALMINEYATASFDSKVEYIKDGDAKEPEANFLGVPFSDIHGNNRADLEYLLTGIDNEFVSFNAAKILIYDMRIIVNLGTYLVDSEKMKKAKEIAEILSTGISLISAGTVTIDPEALQFIVLYVWALEQGFADLVKLTGGESIVLFDHSALAEHTMLEDALLTDYRDYLGLFLLTVPVDWKLSRILTLLKKDCGGELYKGVSLSMDYRGSSFMMEDTYDAYAAE